jgi:hypothetical protein
MNKGSVSPHRKFERNEAIYQRVKDTPDIGIFSVLARELNISRERVRQLFRNEEVERGDVFHKLVSGKKVRLGK